MDAVLHSAIPDQRCDGKEELSLEELRAFLLRFLCSRYRLFLTIDDLEDVVQAAFLAYYLRLAKRPVANRDAFVFAVARNKVRDLLRLGQRERMSVTSDVLKHVPVADKGQEAVDLADAYAAVAKKAGPEAVADFVDNACGDTQGEIARRGGVSRGKVYRRVRAVVAELIEIWTG